jgi:hypothetical protein
MDETPDSGEAANLRFLRILVTVLTATMIAGLLVLIVLFVTRFPDQVTPLPDSITLPAGETATAFTQSRSWYAVVTADEEILIFDRETGTLRQRIAIAAE